MGRVVLGRVVSGASCPDSGRKHPTRKANKYENKFQFVSENFAKVFSNSSS